MHPFMLHATSQNVLRHGRMISNPPIALREPLRFDRDDPRDFSAVESAVLRGLGVERLPFAAERRAGAGRAPAGPRPAPPRQAEEAARLAAKTPTSGS